MEEGSVGYCLTICSAAFEPGVERLMGDVLRSNEAMLTFAMKTGFNVAPRSGDPRAVRIVKDISSTQAIMPSGALDGPALPKGTARHRAHAG